MGIDVTKNNYWDSKKKYFIAGVYYDIARIYIIYTTKSPVDR